MRCVSMVAALFLAAGSLAAKDTNTAGLSAKEAKEGFVSLFDGRTLKGWQGDVKGYVVEKGAIVCNRTDGNLFTAKQYANFVFRFEFKLPRAGNNGVGIRTPMQGIPAYVGMEIQILDDGHPTYRNIEPWQAHGSIYGVVPAKRGSLKPVGKWYQEEIVANGSRIKVTVNGRAIVDADLSKIDKTPDHEKHPGLHNAKGYVGWLGHNDPVAFRNIRIKPLP